MPPTSAVVLRRRLNLEEPASFFYDGNRPLRAEDITDPYRHGILVVARATSRAERAWLREVLSDPDATLPLFLRFVVYSSAVHDPALPRAVARRIDALDPVPPAGRTPPRSGATVRPLRRDRLGGLVHEYVQVA
jgi:hypothetical protein